MYFVQFYFVLLASSIKGKSTVFIKINNENKKAFINKKTGTKRKVCVCVCVCGHVYVVYEDTNLYNDMGMT